MEQLPTSPFQLAAIILLLLAGAFSREMLNIIKVWRSSSDKRMKLKHDEEARKQKAEMEKLAAKRTETEKVLSYYDNIVEEYARQLANTRTLEAEVQQLRPLVLKVALQAQKLELALEDKDDWKKHATKLSDQLEKLGYVPVPFRRTPRDGDTDEGIKTISRRMKAIQEENPVNGDLARPATRETPTIVSPSVNIKTDEVTVEKDDE